MACNKWIAALPQLWDIFRDRHQTIAEKAKEEVAAYDAELKFLNDQKGKLEKKCLGAVRVKITTQLNQPGMVDHGESSTDAVIKLSLADDDSFQGEGPLHFQERGTATLGALQCEVSMRELITLRASGA